jgi:hypothetical protein
MNYRVLGLFGRTILLDQRGGGGMTAQLTARQVGDVSIVDVAGRVTVAGGSNALRETLRELTSRGKK